jgi:hypothetical protein
LIFDKSIHVKSVLRKSRHHKSILFFTASISASFAVFAVNDLKNGTAQVV